ncbi:MAG: indole-3-glycerol phosphate synthase TrpC [Acidimicrobiia bacterium]
MLSQILEAADRRAAIADSDIDRHRSAATVAAPPRSFIDALRSPGLSVIAEIKRRSPSAGAIATDLDPAGLAVAYQAGGADAISVLTEPEFFGGSLDDLTAVRAAVSVPVLRKDFTRSSSQIWEARAAGADAVLLIVAALTDQALVEMLATASKARMAAIVEAHTVDEARRAVGVGAQIIGVNNRDLTTFEVDLGVAERVAQVLPPSAVTIGESGVSNLEGAQRMERAGYDAILVGEALVRGDDPALLVASLKAQR